MATVRPTTTARGASVGTGAQATRVVLRCQDCTVHPGRFRARRSRNHRTPQPWLGAQHRRQTAPPPGTNVPPACVPRSDKRGREQSMRTASSRAGRPRRIGSERCPGQSYRGTDRRRRACDDRYRCMVRQRHPSSRLGQAGTGCAAFSCRAGPQRAAMGTSVRTHMIPTNR